MKVLPHRANLSVVVALLITAGTCGLSQATSTPGSPCFEVATIRPSQSENAGVSFQVAPMRFRAEAATLTDLILFAYHIPSKEQVQQAPHWASTERFDVDAKIDDAQATATKSLAPSQQMEQYRLMLQSLLKERFALRVHEQAEEMPVYALEPARDGPRLAATATPLKLPNLSGWSSGRVVAHGVKIGLLCEGLSGREDVGGRIVVDETGLKGSYDFTLNWTQTWRESPGSLSPDAAGVPLFTALREQLGLKLVAKRAPVDVLLLDHAEHPSPN